MPRTPNHVVPPVSPSAPDDPIEIMKSRSPEGFGFSFKVRATGQIYRFEPMRYPREPRFWCLSVQRCLANGTADPDERAWIGEALLSREELAQASLAVRADVAAWLNEAAHAQLRRWLMEGAPRVPEGVVASQTA